MMTPEELRSRFGGVISFPVTPFKRDDLRLDLEGLKRNLASHAAYPMCAVVAAGGTGETYSLDLEEHAAVVKAVVDQYGGKTAVIAGVCGSLPIALAQARRAAELGADGILALPPYYADAADDGLAAYYRAIGAATPLGLLVYSRGWVNPSPAFVKDLADSVPTLVAWKEGQANIRRYQMITNYVGDRLYWIGGAGDDMVPAYYAMGIRTYTSSIATVAPKLALELHTLGAAGKFNVLHRLMNEFVIPMYRFRARKGGFEVTAMKAAMDAVGLVGGAVRPPLPDLSAAEVEEIGAMMGRWQEWL